MNDDALRDLARRAGIAVEWRDISSQEHVVAPDILRRILSALDLPCATREDLEQSHQILERKPSIDTLPPLVMATVGIATSLDVETDAAISARLELEGGGSREVTLLPEQGRPSVPPIAEAGYHRLLLSERQIVLAVAPTRCRTINDIVPDARLWGISAQVYSLRQPGDAGIGDAAGVALLAEVAGQRGADALASVRCTRCLPLIPLGSAPTRPPPAVSEPAARRTIVGVRRAGDGELVAETGLAEEFARLEALPLIDSAGCRRREARAVPAIVRCIPAWSRSQGALGSDFARFRADGGDLLAQHGVRGVVPSSRLRRI